MWVIFLQWLKDNQIGDLTGILGILISALGFCVTAVGVFKSKAASERAEKAAQSARESIKLFDTVVDFTTAISILEEIKRTHRSEQWILLPDKYSTIRKLLISLKSSNSDLSASQVSSIQTALKNLTGMERTIEKAINSKTNANINVIKLNEKISDDIDKLFTVLADLKISKTGS